MKATRGRLAAALALVVIALATAGIAAGEGSGTIYRGADPTAFRSHLEWRISSYGGGDSPEFTLLRRTLLRLYAREGEEILLGSSAVGVPDGFGDIRVFNPGQVTGSIGQERIPDLVGAAPADGVFDNGFSCEAQRADRGEVGRIANVTEEQAGPLPAVGGYNPCVYVAPATGIYSLVFTGPSGQNSNAEPEVSGELNPTPADFGIQQRTSVTAWDVTVVNDGTVVPGRLFTYYYAGNTGRGGRPLSGQSYVVTDSGFVYRVFFTGDPFGFIFYANQRGFQNSDGTPLYRNLLADENASFQEQNELQQLVGSVRLLPPTFPIFISPPDPLALQALGIPLEPVAPRITDFAFSGADGESTGVGEGGTFSLVTTQPGIFAVVVSRDGVSFDPTAPGNRLLLGNAAAAGPASVTWDGRDNRGELFPEGEFVARAAVQGGEVHFPQLDVENNLAGGPEIELLNPPDVTGDDVGDCPPLNGGCFGAFYDDRGYLTAAPELAQVGTAVNGPLCPSNDANPRGFGNPPDPLASDALRGFDTRGDQRAFGFAFDANPGSVCLPNGGFGDKKGLDLWTYYPSNVLTAPLRVVGPTAVSLLSLTASRAGDGVTLRWETGAELGTAGFHILRSPTGRLDDAGRVTARLIPARGGPAAGATYSATVAAPPEAAGDEAYWLEEVETSGATVRYGPVRPVAAVADRARVWLPLVVR